jgi:hypothetical protein
MAAVTSRLAAISILLSLLSACGSDSGSSPPSTAIVPPVTVPSSTSPPTTQPPSSQYVPAPVPAPVFPLSFDESFDVTAISGFSYRQVDYVDILRINQVEVDQMRALASPNMPRVIWSQPAQRMRLEYIGPATEYGATQTEQMNDYRIFSNQSTRLVIGWANPTRYAKLATWSRRIGAISWKGLTGEETQSFLALVGNTSTIPWDTSRTLRYEGTAFTAPWDIRIDSLDFSAFPRLPGDNRVSGVAALYAVEPGKSVYLSSLRFQGTFNIATNRFTGEITDPIGGYTGTFEGAVFGPTHDEVGLIFNFSRAIDGGKVYSGIGIGTRYFL